MSYKSHIKTLKRVQTSQSRDLKNGVLIDRNERVQSFNLKTYNKIIKSISRHSLNATPDIQSLYKKISEVIKVKKENIYIGQGITELISQIIFSLVKKNDEVIIMDPTYPMFEVWCKLHNVKYKRWKFNRNFQLNFNELKQLINKRTKVIFLVNPNLPIEYEFKKEQKNEIYRLCERKGITVVFDEAYYHFGSKSEVQNALKKKNTIVMRTFSKAWGLPSIRLGFLITNKKLCNYISKCRSLVETNALSFQVAMWALKNPYILQEHVKQIKEGSKYLQNEFKKINQDYLGGNVTNGLLIKLKKKSHIEKIKKFMWKRKIYVRANFKDRIGNYFRISLGSLNKMKIFYKSFVYWKKHHER